MEIRHAAPADLPDLLALFDAARRFMAQNGNPHQWGRRFPTKEMLEADISAQRSYICEDEGRLAAAFCLEWCLARCGNIRIDTHRDNQPMQRLLARLGYTFCGLIDLKNGRGERLAYQKRSR